MPSKYSFSEYSADWPLEFARESVKLQSLLGDELLTIHHIGSTSVPGLPAKPIIDLLPVVRDILRIDHYACLLEEAGYKTWGEYGLVGRRFFTKDCEEYRTHNIHIYQQRNSEIERHIAFCTYLRHHDNVRQAYGELKRAVYSRHPADIMAYNDGKDDWIKRIEPLAIEWFRNEFSSQASDLQ